MAGPWLVQLQSGSTIISLLDKPGPVRGARGGVPSLTQHIQPNHTKTNKTKTQHSKKRKDESTTSGSNKRQKRDKAGEG